MSAAPIETDQAMPRAVELLDVLRDDAEEAAEQRGKWLDRFEAAQAARRSWRAHDEVVKLLAFREATMHMLRGDDGIAPLVAIETLARAIAINITLHAGANRT